MVQHDALALLAIRSSLFHEVVLMRKILRNFAVLAIAILSLWVIFPHQASATVTINYNDSDTCIKNAQANATAALRDRTAASNQMIQSVQPIDAQAFSCVQMILSGFDINFTISNPWNLLKEIASQAIMQILNQACTAVLAAKQAAIKSALSVVNLACLPLPHIGLNASFNLGLPVVSCDGIGLVNATVTPQTPVQPGRYQFLGKQW